jgi:threonyl-tRNA synthetase
MAVSISLPDGSLREYAEGSTLEDVAASISSGLRKNAVGGKLNGVLVDLNTHLVDGAQVELVTLDSKEGLEMMRHSTAHLLAQAVKRLYGNKEVKLGIGPVIEDGSITIWTWSIRLIRKICRRSRRKWSESLTKICR